MSRSTGCIVYPKLWLKGAIFQPVLQDGTGNLSWAFLARALGSVQRGNVHHVNSSIPQHAESHAASTAAALNRQKSWGEGNQKGLTGASQRCAQPCQEMSHILAGQAQSPAAQKLRWSLKAEKHLLSERRFWLEIMAGGSKQDSSMGEHG